MTLDLTTIVIGLAVIWFFGSAIKKMLNGAGEMASIEFTELRADQTVRVMNQAEKIPRPRRSGNHGNHSPLRRTLRQRHPPRLPCRRRCPGAADPTPARHPCHDPPALARGAPRLQLLPAA